MTTRIYFLSLLLSISIGLIAQAPASFNYQAVVRDDLGNLVTNDNLTVRISINAGGSNGSTSYRELHAAQTNQYGLINIQVGTGTPDLGTFNDVDWANNTHFIKVEVDLDGGIDFTEVGAMQLLSVPYALHAATADNVDDADADPTNELQDLSKSGNTISISGGNSITLNDDNATNEIQTISKLLDTIALSNTGGKVVLEDDDPTNELQTLSRSVDTIRLSNGGGLFIDQKNDADFDPGNELQSLSKNGNLITLSNGGSVTIDDNDADSTNELQNLIRLDDNLIISGTQDTVNAPEGYALKYIICVNSTSQPLTSGQPIETAMVGEVKLFAGTQAPAGWAFCEGQILPIASYPGLFGVIGATYGGDGVLSFALPNLINKTAVHKQ